MYLRERDEVFLVPPLIIRNKFDQIISAEMLLLLLLMMMMSDIAVSLASARLNLDPFVVQCRIFLLVRLVSSGLIGKIDDANDQELLSMGSQ